MARGGGAHHAVGHEEGKIPPFGSKGQTMEQDRPGRGRARAFSLAKRSSVHQEQRGQEAAGHHPVF